MRLVFIHGRSQQGKSPAALKVEWLDALNRGLAAANRTIPEDTDIRVPFYGDVLDQFSRENEVPLTGDARAKGGAAKKFEDFKAAALRSIRDGAKVGKDQLKEFFEDSDDTAEKGLQNLPIVRAIVRFVDKRFTRGSGYGIELFLKDVFLYVNTAGVRDKIDKIVHAEIGEGPTVIVSHSLGTVVAYSIFSRGDGHVQAPLFLTLGSPLGIHAVRDKFRPINFPAGVGAWHNAFDAEDIVALRALDDVNFPIAPAISNYGEVKNHTDNRHGIAGYLDDPTVAALIAAAVG